MRPQFRMVPLYLGDRINRRGLLHLWLHLHRDFHLVRLYRMDRYYHLGLSLR